MTLLAAGAMLRSKLLRSAWRSTPKVAVSAGPSLLKGHLTGFSEAKVVTFLKPDFMKSYLDSVTNYGGLVHT